MKSVYRAFFFGCTSLALAGCVNATKSIVNSGPDNSTTAQVATAPALQSTGSRQVGSASCSSLENLGTAYDAPIRGDVFNDALFDGAVLHFTNQQRCAGGLSPLTADAGLRTAARGHSADMARMNFFAHNSPVPGKTKFFDRMRSAGVSFNTAAENLGRNSVLSLDSGRPFFVIDRPTCQFSYQQGGSPIGPHTYRTLGQKMVESWNNSPEHRQNLMGSQFTRVGTGGAFAPNSKSCGDILATQNFAA